MTAAGGVGRVQELNVAVIHLWIELIELALQGWRTVDTSAALAVVAASLGQAKQGMVWLREDQEGHARIVAAAELIATRLGHGGKLLWCGKAGSTCDAMHFAEELSTGPAQ